jgi:hypothetical protein
VKRSGATFPSQSRDALTRYSMYALSLDQRYGRYRNYRLSRFAEYKRNTPWTDIQEPAPMGGLLEFGGSDGA